LLVVDHPGHSSPRGLVFWVGARDSEGDEATRTCHTDAGTGLETATGRDSKRPRDGTRNGHGTGETMDDQSKEEAHAAIAGYLRVHTVLTTRLGDYLYFTEASHTADECVLASIGDDTLIFTVRDDGNGVDAYPPITMPIAYLHDPACRAAVRQEHADRQEQRARDRAEAHQRRGEIAEERARALYAQLKAKYEGVGGVARETVP